MKQHKAYIYKLKKTGRNEYIKNAAAILALIAVEILIIVTYLNQCFNHIINN